MVLSPILRVEECNLACFGVDGPVVEDSGERGRLARCCFSLAVGKDPGSGNSG